ncbi:MAG: hypothetical protein JNM18_12495 [Planctomycetaceae bacterium]|nr:hypothetical protein [Planctomycetaceae bacterium]
MKVFLMKSKTQSIPDVRTFSNWTEAQSAGYFSKTHWKKQGKGIKGPPSATINVNGKDFKLYSKDQTTTKKPRTLACESLLDRFVRRDDIAGYQPHRTLDWKQFRPINGLRNLIKAGWNLKKCHAEGISIGKLKAQAFSIRTAEKTNFFCIDLDCHTPTAETAKVHLSLVQSVVTLLPDVLDQLGGGSSFAQYRQIDTSGIQLWGTTSWAINTKALHKAIRDRLTALGPNLDKKLAQAGLPRLSQIEIAPTEKTQISVPGCYGKTVFTTRELKVTEGWFDVVGLHEHISKNVPLGNVIPRYSELLQASAGLFEPFKIPVIREKRQVLVTGRDLQIPVKPKVTKRDYWTRLKTLATDGVPEPDQLFDYLLPLAQGLLFRDFFAHPSRHGLTAKELLSWVRDKGNGLVSRLERGQIDLLEDGISRAVSLADGGTAQAVRDYWLSVRENDLRYPSRIELLSSFMRKGGKWDTHTRTIVKCTALPRKSNGSRVLPQVVLSRIEEASKKHLKSSPHRKRFIDFSKRFLTHIANNPDSSISWQTLNELCGKKGKAQRTTQNQFKSILVQAGLLKPDWERTIRRNQSAARYSLSDWAKEQMGN